jgi:predicted nucleic acid-binding protein
MIFVDTGYLLAVLNPRDELYERAQRWAAAIDERLVTTECVLWELVNTLSAPVDRPKAHEAIAEIRSSENWELVLYDIGVVFRGLIAPPAASG